MANPVNPPDGWTVTEGTWGDDFLRDETIGLTTGSSLRVSGVGTGPTQTIVGPWMPIDGNGAAYSMMGVVFAFPNLPTAPITIKLEIYAANRTTLTKTEYILNNAPVNPTTQWRTLSSEFTTTSACNWARFVVTRVLGVSPSVYIDRLEVKKIAPRCGMYKAADQTMPAAAPTQVSFTADYANLIGTPSITGAPMNLFRAGLYLLTFRTEITGMASGQNVLSEFQVEDSPGVFTTLGRSLYTAAGASVIFNQSMTFKYAGATGYGSGLWVRLTPSVAGLVIKGTAASSSNTSATAFTAVWMGLG